MTQNIFVVGTVEEMKELNKHFNVHTLEGVDFRSNAARLNNCDAFVLSGKAWEDSMVSMLAGYAAGGDIPCYALKPVINADFQYISMLHHTDTMEELIEALRQL